MADKGKTEAADAAPAPAGKFAGKKKLIIMIGGGVVVLLIVAVAAFMLLGKKHAPDGEEEEPVKAKQVKKGPPAFVPLDQLIVNLQPDQGEQFLQVSISLEVADAKEGDNIKAYMPKIKAKVLRLLSSKKSSEINTPEGKDALADEVKRVVNTVILGDDAPKEEAPKKGKKKAKVIEPEGPVISVLFTAFIIQ